MLKNILSKFILFFLIFCLSPVFSKAQAATLGFEGEWLCVNTALNDPQKNINRSITKINDTEYESKLKSPYTELTQIFILKGDLLIQKEAADFGLMIQDEKLQSVNIENGNPVKPPLGQIVCERVK